MLDRVKIVLVEPQHPGNIGAAARAMKTMGLSRLVLVKPGVFPHKDAYVRATHATEILEQCVVAETLKEVIADCTLIIGTSTRDRGGYIPALNVRHTAEKLVHESQSNDVALVFGTESTGLTGEDLRQCHFYGYIPTAPDYSSLNLASAVQTFCYEIFQYSIDSEKVIDPRNENEFPKNEDLIFFYERLETLLTDSNFINQKHPGIVMQRLRSVFNRARLDQKELNLLQGMISSLVKKSR